MTSLELSGAERVGKRTVLLECILRSLISSGSGRMRLSSQKISGQKIGSPSGSLSTVMPYKLVCPSGENFGPENQSPSGSHSSPVSGNWPCLSGENFGLENRSTSRS